MKEKLHFRRHKYQAVCKEYWPWEQDNSEDKRFSRLERSAKYSAVLLLSHEVRPFHARKDVQCPSSPPEMPPTPILFCAYFPQEQWSVSPVLRKPTTSSAPQQSPIIISYNPPHPHPLWHSLLLFLSHLPHLDTSNKIDTHWTSATNFHSLCISRHDRETVNLGWEDVFYFVNPELLFSSFPQMSLFSP